MCYYDLMAKPITLDRFFKEFVNFVKGQEKRWVSQDKRWEENEKRWVSQDKRWEENEKRWVSQERSWKDNKKQLNRIENKFDKLFDFIDKDVMEDRKRIKTLEDKVFASD